MSRLVLGHVGQLLQPHDVMTAWSLDWWTIALLLGMAAVYARGSAALAVRAPEKALRSRRWFIAGWVVVALALVSPVHAFGETLLSAHMVQHELLVALAAPLLVIGKPDAVFLHAMPADWRRRSIVRPAVRTMRIFLHPLVAAAMHATALVVGHLPSVYQATLSSDVVHASQHIAFFGTAMLFWWAMLRSRGIRAGRGVSIVMLFAVMVATGILGAWLTWSRILWYPAYVFCNPSWGLNPLEDQQLAGLIMWIPGGIAYLTAAVWLFARWMEESGQRVARREAMRVTVRPLAMLLFALLAVGCADSAERVRRDAELLAGGSVPRGRRLIKQVGCGSCHTVPGVTGATGKVGPSLDGIASRAYIGGVAENTPENLVNWIQNPPGMAPKTAMPNLGLSPSQAKDIAAYLYTLR